MAKAVFRPGELTVVTSKIILDAPGSSSGTALAPAADEAEAADESGAVEEYSGPTADDIRREAEAFKLQWDQEREALVRSAKVEADGIIKEAEGAAFAEVKRKIGEAQSLKRQAEDDAARIIEEARIKARQIEDDSLAAFENDRKEAEERGRIAGQESGFIQGRDEVERLVQRTQTILERAQGKRAEILAETEQQIIDLVLLISRKVIKVISENQRNIVVSNVIEALRKVKGRGNIFIRVNMADVKLASEHKKDFIEMMEGAKSIQIVEDTTVDSGGCIIETDFGEIDARIASQLSELEQKILEISPIRSRAKTGSVEGI
ncbi:MAG: flagellar assembly protein FliH [Spirochaetaceae bacterium]|jgi:flagellar assembly protein FliH|nr:flagellar assembly protein FliH [Spirochaetaceae bacterium]